MEDDSEAQSLMSDSLKFSLLSGIQPNTRRTADSPIAFPLFFPL